MEYVCVGGEMGHLDSLYTTIDTNRHANIYLQPAPHYWVKNVVVGKVEGTGTLWMI